MEVKRKRLTREQKREQAVVDLINQMFIIAGHQVTYDDIKDRKDNWFWEWTMTMQQYEDWKVWGKKYIMKNEIIRKKWEEFINSKYKKIDSWLNNFLFPVIEKSWKLLSEGGHMAINISDVYCNHTINKICDPMNDFISKLEGSKKIENINYRMAKRIKSNSEKTGIFVEPVWMWRKE